MNKPERNSYLVLYVLAFIVMFIILVIFTYWLTDRMNEVYCSVNKNACERGVWSD